MSDTGDRVKFVVLGSGGVGKSALVMRLVTGNFLEAYDPTIEDSHHKTLVVDDKTYNLDILDTAGQEDFKSMEDSWFQLGQAFLLVYSITMKSTYDEIQNTYDRLLRSKDRSPPIVLIGNKSDLESMREIQKADGAKLAQSWGVPFFETSAKLSANEDVFAALVKAHLKQKPSKKDDKKPFCMLL